MPWLSATRIRPEPDIVQRCIGTFGRWHWWVALWTNACRFTNAWHLVSIIFHTPPANFTCADTNISNGCSPNCTERVFDRSMFTETITTQWDLVCGRFHYNNIVQFTTMCGILVGGLMFGTLADRYGRRIPFISCVVVQAVIGSAAALVPWYWGHIVLRFLCTIGTGGTILINFVLVMEIVGLKRRTLVILLSQIPFILGHLSLPLIAYFLRDWRMSQLFISLMSVILFAYFWIIPESPRWLLIVGKKAEAIKVLEKAARWNRLPTEHIEASVTEHLEHHPQTNKKGGNMLALFRTPSLRTKTICIGFNWLVSGMYFYGMAQFIGELEGDTFINVAISAAIHIPGTLITIWAAEKLGRKPTLIISNLISAVPALIMAACPDDPVWVKPTLGTLGMFGVSMSFPIAYIFAGELFPTIVRNIGCGTCSLFARIGCIAAPFIAKPANAPKWLPPLILGLAPIFGALLCIFLPETVNCILPDTLEEAEAFGKKVKRRDVSDQEMTSRQNDIH